MAHRYCHHHCVSTKKTQKYIHYSLEMLNTGKNEILYICFLKYLTKIFFKKLKLPSTEFYV